MLQPVFYQAWVASPESVEQLYANGIPDAGVHAWICVCRDVTFSERMRARLPEAVRPRCWVFTSITSQLNDILRLLHRLILRGVSVGIVCETGKQRAPTLWAAYLLWQTQLHLDTVLRILRDTLPEAFLPNAMYMDLLQYVEQHRRHLV